MNFVLNLVLSVVVVFASGAVAKTITIQPSIKPPMEKVCRRDDNSAGCRDARKKIVNNLLNLGDIVLKIGITKEGHPIGSIRLSNQINGMDCYLLKVTPTYSERIGITCEALEQYDAEQQ